MVKVGFFAANPGSIQFTLAKTETLDNWKVIAAVLKKGQPDMSEAYKGYHLVKGFIEDINDVVKKAEKEFVPLPPPEDSDG